MSTHMYGLDPQDCRDFVKILKDSAAQLERTSTQLSHTVARTGWQGPDSQRFRQQWPGNRSRLNQTARDLDDMASVVLRNIAEQERASAVDDAGGTGGDSDGGSFWDDLVEGGRELWDDVAEGAGNVLDEVRDGLDWISSHIQANLDQAGGTYFSNLAHLGQMGADIFSGNPPSAAGLLAQMVLTAGAGGNLAFVASTGGLMNTHLFDDGEPFVGAPQTITEGSANPVQLPASVSSIFGSVEDAYAVGQLPGTDDGAIRILRVQQEDGSDAYIVNIPGTEQWGPTGSGQARDLTSNFMLVAGQSTTAQRDIILAMEAAGIDSGDPVMLAGHSQGGILAVQLGSDPDFLAEYNVTNILTAGSPIDTTAVASNINVLAVQHDGDLVPTLDLGGLDTHLQMPGTPSNVTVVTMDDPPRDLLGNVLHNVPLPVANMVQGVRDIIGNHATDAYRANMENTSQYPGLGSYEQDPSTSVFLTDDPTRVTGVDIPVARQ